MSDVDGPEMRTTLAGRVDPRPAALVVIGKRKDLAARGR
jgi:hypothetical protein